MSVIPATQKAEAKMKAAWATQRILDQGGQFHENLSENLGKRTVILLDSYIIINWWQLCYQMLTY